MITVNGTELKKVYSIELDLRTGRLWIEFHYDENWWDKEEMTDLSQFDEDWYGLWEPSEVYEDLGFCILGIPTNEGDTNIEITTPEPEENDKLCNL